MGLLFFKRSREPEGPAPQDTGDVNERYKAYFPRLFAYVRSCVGGDMPAQDIVVQAFCRAFSKAKRDDEDSFRTILFRTARRLCLPALRDGRAGDNDSLSPREREVMSLVFDAGFTLRQITEAFRIRETTASALLMAGLRKLKAQTSPAAAAAYLKFA